MKVLIIDLSGKVTSYDEALYEAVKTQSCTEVSLVAPDLVKGDAGVIHLLSLIPSKIKYTENPIKRVVKAIEGLLNYVYLLFLCIKRKPDVLHFQWFPFMEVCSVDIIFVKILRALRHDLKLVLTVHNVFPHNLSMQRKRRYKERFMKMSNVVDHYIAHTESSKDEIAREFGLSSDRIDVVPHGIFTPDFQPKDNVNISDEYKIIMYGNNLPYKGADILLDAVQLLPEELKKKIKVTIVGATSNDFLELLKEKSDGLHVSFNPTFVPDDELYTLIDEADYIALPYKRITQSGVLLLALYFRKPLLISDLPSFVDTLHGFTSDMFFKSEDAASLKDLIQRHIEGKVDTTIQKKAIEELNELYSWHNSAIKTIEVYNTLNSDIGN